jgi:hypothetical protein
MDVLEPQPCISWLEAVRYSISFNSELDVLIESLVPAILRYNYKVPIPLSFLEPEDSIRKKIDHLALSWLDYVGSNFDFGWSCY